MFYREKMYFSTLTITLVAFIATVSSLQYGSVETPSPQTSSGGYGGSQVSNPVQSGYGGRSTRPYAGRQRGYGSGGIHGPSRK